MSDPLDQTALLADPFYDLKPALGRNKKGDPIVQPGQLVWAHIVRPVARPYIVDVKGYDPRDAAKNAYVISQLGSNNPTHFPIKELNLRSDENLYILYGKKRPAVVLQTVSANFFNQSNPEPFVLVAPRFTFKERHSDEYRARAAAMEFGNLFFLPKHPIASSEQGVIRFEHIQPVAAAGVEPEMRDGARQQCFLSETAWAVLQHRLSLFFVGKPLDEQLEKDLEAYRECVMEAYRP